MRQSNTLIHAHKWEILNGDRIPRWPDEEDERTIRATINSWVGTSIGARHVYCRVEEEKNHWWCEEKNAWVELSCDSGRGYSLSADCMTKREAEEVADFFVELIKRNNPNQPYQTSKEY